MRKIVIASLLSITYLVLAYPALADSADLAKVQSFAQSVIQVLVTMAGLIAAGYLVFGGIRYIMSTGHPEALDRSKKTILYSALGLTIALGAYVLTNIISQLATSAFGK